MPWVVRFEDIDQPRVHFGAKEQQLADMRALGLVPDQILVQSTQLKRHRELFIQAIHTGQIYPCTCSRKEVLQSLQAMASAPHEELPLYSGHCREAPVFTPSLSNSTLAWRFRSAEDPSGRLDFIVARTEALPGDDPRLVESFAPAYHWACAIDDYDGDHSLLVRASDLKHVLAFQKQVHQWVRALEGTSRCYPAVFHASLVTAHDGSRLEKRTRGVTLPELEALGISANRLREKLDRSFDQRRIQEYQAGKAWSETSEKITLSELQL